jgi:hypothetical protein
LNLKVKKIDKRKESLSKTSMKSKLSSPVPTQSPKKGGKPIEKFIGKEKPNQGNNTNSGARLARPWHWQVLYKA